MLTITGLRGALRIIEKADYNGCELTELAHGLEEKPPNAFGRNLTGMRLWTSPP